MAIRDLLLPLLTYPTPTPVSAIEAVIGLAEHLSKPWAGAHSQIQARISALILETEIEPGLYYEGSHIGEFLEAESRKSSAHARDLDQAFNRICKSHAVLWRCRAEKHNAYQGQVFLIEEARLHHLTLLPVKKNDENHQDIAERLIFESGRPVVIFPEHAVRPLAKSFDTVAVAWDGSRAAARAVADAMPFLRRAKHVRIFSATDEKPMPSASRGQEIAQQLVSDGVDTIYEEVSETRHGIGSFLESYVAAHNVDLLVMGAFAHSRLRDFILGGATRSILMNPPGWVLLSH